MTAVIQPLPRNGWSNTQTEPNNMSSEDVSRILVPRKSTQRTNSSSSLASSASASSTGSVASSSSSTSTSTVIPASNQTNGTVNGETSTAARKKPTRGLWPSSAKSEPVAGISNARSQSVPVNPSGSAATPAVSALHSAPYSASQQGAQPQSQANGIVRGQSTTETHAVLNLQSLNGTFERKTIAVPFTPDLIRIGRQTNQKTLPTPANGYFDSKVLSRQHAEIWADRDGKIWIRDVKSSNGTFVNGKRLSQENRDSEPHTLQEADLLELGIDIVSEDQKTIVHHKVAARVDYAGLYSPEKDPAHFNESDDAAAGLPGNQSTGQNGRGRAVNHAHPTNGRFTGAGAAAANMPAAAYHAKWLQPVTMEQIVRRLNNELKQARTEASSLQNACNYVGSVVANDVEPNESNGPDSDPFSKKSHGNLKTEIASPAPAPPPTQPSPEAPSEIPSEAVLRERTHEVAPLHGSLRRSDTERPVVVPDSPETDKAPLKLEQSSQILSLVEALSTAQKEIVTQGEKLKEMEAELNREREERRSAQERVGKLEAGTSVAASLPNEHEAQPEPNSVSEGQETQVEDVTSLKQRIELMRAEMDGMKDQMEKYRQRANNAEHDALRDRSSLAEMIQSIRRREDAAKRRAEKKRLNSKKAETAGTTDATTAEDREIEQLDRTLEQELNRSEERLRHLSESDGDSAHQNGVAKEPNVSIAELQQLGKAAMAAMAPQKAERGLDDTTNPDLQNSTMTKRTSRRQQQLAQTAPYASMLGVVLLGVGLMAYLNGWQKVAER